MLMKPPVKILITLAMVLALTGSALGAEVRFQNQEVKDSVLTVSFLVEGYQRKDIIEAIRRGMEVKITYHVELIENRLMGSRVLKRSVFSRSIKYDYWNKAFQVKERDKSSLFQSEGAMLEYFFSVKSLPVANTRTLSGGDLAVRIKAELKSVELYFPMNLIFKYIVGFWDFKTAWSKGPPLRL